MKTRKLLAIVLSLVMVLSLCGTAFAYHLTDEITELETNNSDRSMEIATQAYTLLENNGVLPLKGEKKIALYGNAIAYTVKGGTGSGAVNNRLNAYGVNGDNIADAFADADWEVTNPNYVDSVRLNDEGQRYTLVQGARAITDEQIAEGLAADTAIYAIARNAGEGSDRQIAAGNGAYNLSDLELANIQKVCDAYENVIIVYNTCVMDAAWQEDYDNIDAVVYMNNGGQRGSEALVKCLTGEVNFSGKLGDTWAKSIYDYPSTEGFANLDGNTMTEYYVEGVYVGYRYFDTFGKDVCYPFGYGLSYTQFDVQALDVSITADKVTVDVAVTNIGDTYSGKEVVEVYFSAPDGTLEKPYQELAAFGKTDELQPGESQILTISYDTADMSSYSVDEAGYIMEAGDYIIRVGNSSRNTHVAAVGTLAQTVVTEKLINQFPLEDGAVLNEITKDGATPITYDGEAEEIANAKRIRITGIETVVNDDYNDAETITTYLFAEDAENYTPRDEITIQTRVVNGIINNAENPDGPQFRGYSTTTYAEEVEIVPDLPAGITKENAKLTDVYKGDITLEQFVACLTPEELARFCVGRAGNVQPNPDGEIDVAPSFAQGGAGQTTQELFQTRHIPAMPNADGPAGIRITRQFYIAPNGARYTSATGNNGYEAAGWTADDMTTAYQFCTAFPVGTAIAMTWDIDQMREFGLGVGSEMKEYDVTTWLAPGMNIHRNPLCGRNFEYYSEDPLLTGMSAAYVTLGIQSYSGIGVTLKHFWGNSQETSRNSENNVIGERAAREIYLKGFEIAVKLAQPQCVMNSYNVNQGWPASDDWNTNEDLLRSEWGFEGYVMTDWGGGQSTAFVAKHGGCDMVMPGGNANVILQGYYSTEPTFNEDGSFANLGDFVIDPEGEPLFTVPTNVASENQLSEELAAAVAARQARYQKIGTDATLTWYGYMNMYNKICLGDIQKSAMRALKVDLLSQDMEKLLVGLDIQYTAGSYSENTGADALAEDAVPMVVKSDVTSMAIVAEKVTVDTAEVDSAAVNVAYTGDETLTTVRLAIDSALPIASIESENDFEYNAEAGRIIVYSADGGAIDKDLFTIHYAFDGLVPDGEYPVDLTVEEVTGADGSVTAVIAIDGAVIVDNTYPKGDVTQDGELDNRDLIMIARYLVGLVEFNAKQLKAADFNEDGIVNNSDLVLIARYIVANP